MIEEMDDENREEEHEEDEWIVSGRIQRNFRMAWL